jgi:fibro-slime domain-containing protein
MDRKSAPSTSTCKAVDLGISPGGSYAMDVFHAERHTRGSNFKITTNIACFAPGVVK